MCPGFMCGLRVSGLYVHIVLPCVWSQIHCCLLLGQQPSMEWAPDFLWRGNLCFHSFISALCWFPVIPFISRYLCLAGVQIKAVVTILHCCITKWNCKKIPHVSRMLHLVCHSLVKELPCPWCLRLSLLRSLNPSKCHLNITISVTLGQTKNSIASQI